MENQLSFSIDPYFVLVRYNWENLGMETKSLIEYGEAKKPLSEFTEEDFQNAAENVYWFVRKRAWAAGLPVYYGEGGKIVAEYESGRKMEVDIINGQVIEKGELRET